MRAVWHESCKIQILGHAFLINLYTNRLFFVRIHRVAPAWIFREERPRPASPRKEGRRTHIDYFSGRIATAIGAKQAHTRVIDMAQRRTRQQ
jgi:hypothetical protein